jgi:hypothetical protein
MLMIALPLCRLDTVFHVGTLDKTQKRAFNHEGTHGLSISEHPNAWRRITSGQTAGNTFTLSKSTGCFVDFHAISDERWELLYTWGVRHGWLTQATRHSYSYFDEEMGQDLTFTFRTHQEAQQEVGEDGHEIVVLNKLVGTPAFADIVGLHQQDNASLVVLLYCMFLTQYDGIYWHDDLCVGQLSAPRGVITEHKLSSWLVNKAEAEHSKAIP